MHKDPEINVLGGPLTLCSNDPVTGFFRDGHCNTCEADQGSHTVCAIMTDEFLAFSKYVGNDLSTPGRNFGLPGSSPEIGGACAPRASCRPMTKAARRACR